MSKASEVEDAGNKPRKGQKKAQAKALRVGEFTEKGDCLGCGQAFVKEDGA
jgi:hypothetical protein